MKVFLGESLSQPCRVPVSDPVATVTAAVLTGGAGYLGMKSTPKYPRIGALTGAMAGASVASMALAHVFPQEAANTGDECVRDITLGDSIATGMLTPISLFTVVGALFGPEGVIVGSTLSAAVVGPLIMSGRTLFR